MNKRLSHILTLSWLILFMGLSACEDDVQVRDQGEEEPETNKVKIELFTRSALLQTPLSRATANEDFVGTTPWVLVFKGSNSNSATFVEAEQAFQYPGIVKRYVVLSKQEEDCWLLILANPQSKFYVGGSAYDFDSANFKSKLDGKTLSEACDLLLTEPLIGTQQTVPFVGQSIPMSIVHPAVGGINTDTQIGTSTALLELTRSVARVEVKNSASNFTLNGIVQASNVPNQGQLHNLTSSVMTIAASNLIKYKKSDASNIADAESNSTENNPLYLFESDKANDTHIIINGNYQGRDYYYKMAFIDNSGQKIDLLRNHKYIYDIKKVVGVGHDTVEDAENAPEFNNKAIHLDLTVTDVSAYETTAFDDYYLSVSNSHYIAYSRSTDAFTALSFMTYKITGSVGGNFIMNSGVTLTSPSSSSFTASSTFSAQDVKIKITSVNPYDGEFFINLGNLKKQLTVSRKEPIPAAGGVIKFYDNDDFTYYLLSGKIDNYSSALNWIELTPGTGIVRGDVSDIIVDDGKIQINIKANGGTASRTGTVYLATAPKPKSSAQSEVFRIKLDITQLGQ